MKTENERTTDRWFYGVVGIFCAFWIFAPVWVIPNYRPDLMETLVVGQNWPLATHKHAALTCWWGEIVYQATARASWGPYLAAQICVFLSLLGIRKIAARYLSPREGLLATFAMLSFYFFHFESTLYNNHTTMPVFWIAAVLFWLRAVETNRLGDWILTGVMLGLGLYCKLTVFLLIFSMLAAMTLDPLARRRWRGIGPYLTTFGAMVIFLPFFFWMVRHDFVNIVYAKHSAAGTHFPGISGYFLAPLFFLSSQMLYVAPVTLPLLPYLGVRWKFRRGTFFSSGKNRLLTVVILAPLAIQLLLCVVTKSAPRGALGCHLWYLLPIWLLNLFAPLSEERAYRRALRLSLLLPVVIMGIFCVGVPLSPAITDRASRYHFSGRLFAERVETVWHERFETPLSWIRGDLWLIENASVYAPSRPRMYVPLWSDEDQFGALGGIVMWIDGTALGQQIVADLAERYPTAEILPIAELPAQTRFLVPPTRYGLAVVPPQSVCNPAWVDQPPPWED